MAARLQLNSSRNQTNESGSSCATRPHFENRSTRRIRMRRDDLIQLNFAPNPSFHPPTHEAEVFHAIEGSVWVNGKEARVEEITGHLIHEVKFGGGLLGHLNKGGTFDVKQAEVARGYWEMTLLKVQMKGKALFFKTIGVQQNYSRSDFRQVPDDLTRFAKSACAAIDNRPGRCQAGCRCTVAASCQMRCLLNEVVLSHLRSLEM